MRRKLCKLLRELEREHELTRLTFRTRVRTDGAYEVYATGWRSYLRRVMYIVEVKLIPYFTTYRVHHAGKQWYLVVH